MSNTSKSFNVEKFENITGQNDYSITQFQNGRVTHTELEKSKSIPLFLGEKGSKVVQNNFQEEMLYGIQETSQLNQLFFSRKNLDLIQDMMRYRVYMKSNKKYIIGKQSNTEIQIVMRSIYLQQSTNLPTNIKEQIIYLNNLVVDWCVEKIIPEVEQHIGYIRDISYYPNPIDLPKNMSQKGSRSLRSVTSTF
jgi:hypothetical protein